MRYGYRQKRSEAKTKLLLFKLGLLVIFLLIIGVLISVLLFKKSVRAPVTENQKNSSSDSSSQKTLRLIATGDMIPHDAINQEAKQPDGKYEYSPMFGDMKTIFDKSDLRFCNQAVLAGGQEFGISGYPTFNAPTEFSRDMAELGCNLINTGSNHVNDFSQEVITASVDAWKSFPDVKAVAGANASSSDAEKIRYFSTNGIKFAFVSYTTYTNELSPNGYSVTMYSDELAKRQLAEARNNADIVIASLRWGTEYSAQLNPLQKDQAAKLANFGADIILGHGPHVLQPVDKITLDDGRTALVWYSLGNFLNAQLDPPSLFNGIAVMDIDTTTKKLTDFAYLPVYMHYEWNFPDRLSGNLMTRHNFKMYTFEDGQAALDASLNNTTFDEQRERIRSTLNELTPVRILTKSEYFDGKK